MKLFKCPTRKETRINLTEQEWKAHPWTQKEIEINCALPHHMWGWQQDDRIWPFCHAYRGSSAIGPRAKEFGIMKKYVPSLPKLVKGRGVSRWMAVKNVSVLEIPMFTEYSNLWTEENIPAELNVVERNPSNENFGKLIKISKQTLLSEYGPSTLQKFSDKSKMLRSPWHYSYHKMLKRREVIGKQKKETGTDRVFLTRVGCRWDSLDDYFIKNAVYTGLAWN